MNTGAPTPLRILQLYPKADFFTGAAIQLRDLAVGLKRQGHDVTVATSPSRLWAERLAAAGIAHEPIPMQRAWDPRAVAQLVRIVRRRRIQLIHAHKGRARTLALLAGIVGPRPRLVLNRGVSFPLTRWNRIGYTSGRVDAIVAVCDAIKRDLAASGVPPDKIAVIYSGTDVARFHPAVDGSPIRAELGLDAGHFLVTQVGVRSWRGWPDVLAAMVKIAPTLGRARLLFAGAPPPRIAEVQDRARALGIGGRVFVLGHRDDVPEILSASDVVVDASWAGLGLTGSLREALACGRPVIGTNLAGMPELIEDGRTGLLVPPRDPEALAQAVLKLAADPAWRQEIGRAGRARVEARFSLAAKLAATDALYRNLVRGAS
ncbi:MAG: glycosyltransferase family 4 protein [Candidatus Rokubacteria bacterium]|nr:glycosyltransferase family 4 protein [Candidatus Rokubacteria bacterium]